MTRVTILDTTTGEQYDGTIDASVFWWTEGNGSCDCNRGLMKDGIHVFPCGNVRFLIIDATGDMEGHTKTEILEMANSGFPQNLLEQYKRHFGS